MSLDRWLLCLDRLAEHLARQREALAQGTPQALDPLEAFAPEPGLGPLPPSLAERALQLQEEGLAIEQALAEAAQQVSAALTAAAPAARPVATYLDSHG